MAEQVNQQSLIQGFIWQNIASPQMHQPTSVLQLLNNSIKMEISGYGQY